MALHRLPVVAQMLPEVLHLLHQLLPHLPHHRCNPSLLLLQLDHRSEKPREVPGRRHSIPLLSPRPRNASPLRPTPRSHRIKPAHIQQRRIAPQFPQQRLHRDMLEDDPRHQRPPHRPDRIVVPSPSPPPLQRPQQVLVRQGLQDHLQTLSTPAGVPHRSTKTRDGYGSPRRFLLVADLNVNFHAFYHIETPKASPFRPQRLSLTSVGLLPIPSIPLGTSPSAPWGQIPPFPLPRSSKPLIILGALGVKLFCPP